MKLLPFKLSEQENQSIKEASKGKPFKSFQKEIIICLILLVLALVFLWKHHNLLIGVVVAMAAITGVRYSQALKSSKATYSIGGCDETIALIKDSRLFKWYRFAGTCTYPDEIFDQILSTFRFIGVI